MSYVIQNFQQPVKSLRINVRIKASIILRNFAVIYSLLSDSTKFYNTFALTYVSRRQLMAMASVSFKALARVIFTKINYLRYTPVGLNFPLSARYNTLRNIDNLITRKEKPLNYLSLQARDFRCPYFTGIPIVITPIAKRPFSYTLYKFLRLSLSQWGQWPCQYRTAIHFTNVHSYWYLLTFLNKYYFKLYNI